MFALWLYYVEDSKRSPNFRPLLSSTFDYKHLSLSVCFLVPCMSICSPSMLFCHWFHFWCLPALRSRSPTFFSSCTSLHISCILSLVIILDFAFFKYIRFLHFLLYPVLPRLSLSVLFTTFCTLIFHTVAFFPAYLRFDLRFLLLFYFYDKFLGVIGLIITREMDVILIL